MNDFNADGPSENEWEEQGELAWNEFDWELYLRERQKEVERYLAAYQQAKGSTDRIDETARLMGWDDTEWNLDDSDSAEAAAAENAPTSDFEDLEPYTVHRNPVYIATRAIFLGLHRRWESLAKDPALVSQPLALSFQGTLFRCEEQAMLGVQALDIGDFAMAISIFKRALNQFNATLALLSDPAMAANPAVTEFCEEIRPMLFDLREIWLRVITECRDENSRPIDGES